MAERLGVMGLTDLGRLQRQQRIQQLSDQQDLALQQARLQLDNLSSVQGQRIESPDARLAQINRSQEFFSGLAPVSGGASFLAGALAARGEQVSKQVDAASLINQRVADQQQQFQNQMAQSQVIGQQVAQEQRSEQLGLTGRAQDIQQEQFAQGLELDEQKIQQQDKQFQMQQKNIQKELDIKESAIEQKTEAQNLQQQAKEIQVAKSNEAHAQEQFMERVESTGDTAANIITNTGNQIESIYQVTPENRGRTLEIISESIDTESMPFYNGSQTEKNINQIAEVVNQNTELAAQRILEMTPEQISLLELSKSMEQLNASNQMIDATIDGISDRDITEEVESTSASVSMTPTTRVTPVSEEDRSLQKRNKDNMFGSLEQSKAKNNEVIDLYVSSLGDDFRSYLESIAYASSPRERAKAVKKFRVDYPELKASINDKQQ